MKRWAFRISLRLASCVINLYLVNSVFSPMLAKQGQDFNIVKIGQVRYWAILSEQLGHEGQIRENIMNTWEVTVLIGSLWKFVRMFVSIICRSSLIIGHCWANIRSLGYISGKPCEYSRSHCFDCINTTFCLNFSP